ncbi:MAG: isoprenylcysteine carboxylmethyltransferase family protein [Lachnospiraceae bacterium]|nr:isoprenylcysteine carboxylmethyltransferase family protein [Lachnospiraceae bacterium]
MKKHLPLLGVGPIIGLGQLIITVTIILTCKTLNTDFAEIDVLKTPFRILGVLLIVAGLYFNYSAKRKSKLFENIKQNRLITDGIYRYVRNPVYSAILFCCTGISLFANNLLVLIAPVCCWIYTTIFLIQTEEKWLRNLYGQEYVEYCKRVNRCIPWFHHRWGYAIYKK